MQTNNELDTFAKRNKAEMVTNEQNGEPLKTRG